MVKEKKLKPSKELPLGFVDRKEQELLIRDFIILNIKEVMILLVDFLIPTLHQIQQSLPPKLALHLQQY